MFGKRLATLVVVATSLLLGAAGTASATIEKSSGSPAVGPLTAPLSGTATLVSGSLSVGCTTGSVEFNILSGGSTAYVELTALDVSTCTDSVPLINFGSGLLVGTEVLAVYSTGATSSVWAFQSTFSMLWVLNVGTCTYTSTSSSGGTAGLLFSDISNMLSVNVAMTRTAGSAACPANVTFSATFGPMRDSQGSLVVVN